MARASTLSRHTKVIRDFKALTSKKDAKGHNVLTIEHIIGKLADKHCYSERTVENILKNA